MNKVILMGRLTRDPDVRYSAGDNNSSVARFTIAVDRRFRREGEQQTADFISCVAFGRQAEFCEKYLRQGIKIALTGRIQTGSYTNREGQRVYTTDVVAEELEFAESKNASAANNSGASAGYSQQRQNNSQASKPVPVDFGGSVEGFMNIPDGIDEELPFN